MDRSINGVGHPAIYSIQPLPKKRQDGNGRKKRFVFPTDDQSAPPPESHHASDAHHVGEKLCVSERDDDESGGRLDLTA